MPGSDPISFDDCECIHETDEAILVAIPDLDEEIWFPRATVHEDSEVRNEEDTGTFVVKRWFARKKNLL